MSWRLAGLVAIVCAIVAGPVRSQSGGDQRRGAAIYERCVACHSLTRHRTGPRHCGLLGRRAGGLPDFAYSKAMRESGLVWSRESLDTFLAAPLAVVPGTRMGYAGISDPQDRADIIAFLVSATADSDLCR